MDRTPDLFIEFAQIAVEDTAKQNGPKESLLWTNIGIHAPVVGKLHGFDLLEQPLVSDIPLFPAQLLQARSTVPLKRAMVGREVVVWFENGDVRMPIIMGVMESQQQIREARSTEAGINVQVDDERYVIQAEREIVLRCGDASITLTRAGKVIIKGNYILSRSTGYNKIKGAAIDIN